MHAGSRRSEEAWDRRTAILLVVIGALLAILGLTVLFSWHAGYLLLIQLRPGLTTMKYNVALGFALSGVGLIAAGLGHRRLAPLPGLFLGILSLATLAQYGFGVDFGIDQLVVRDLPGQTLPGRMAPETALALLALALALIACRFESAGVRVPLVQAALGGGVVLFAFVGLFEEWVPESPVRGRVPEMAAHTAAALLAAGSGLLIHRWRRLNATGYVAPLVIGLAVAAVAAALSETLMLFRDRQIARESQAAVLSVRNQIETTNDSILAVERIAEHWMIFGPESQANWELHAIATVRDFDGLEAVAWIDPALRVRWVAPRAASARIRAAGDDPLVRALLEGARRLQRTELARIADPLTGGQGFLLAVSVLRGGAFEGYTVGFFSARQWFDHVLHERIAPGYAIEILHEGGEIYRRGQAAASVWMGASTIELYGVQLDLRVAPTAAKVSELSSPLPRAVLGFGLLAAFLLALAARLRRVAERHARIAEDAATELSRLNAQLEARIGERTAALREELTERRRAEALLAKERERLAVTLYSIGEGVIATDTGGRVELINPAAEQLTGWKTVEGRGRPLSEIFRIVHEQTREPLPNPVELVVEAGRTTELSSHALLLARDGRERLLADAAAPIRDREGSLIGVVLIFRDVTERRMLMREALKSQKLESVGLLAGGIAHDFNNILTAMVGNLALAKRSARHDPRLSELLGAVETASWRARDLTTQLLTFAKGGAPVRRPGAIADLVADSTAFCLRGSNVEAQVDLPPDLATVEFDAPQISQVVHNIALNAVQAMPEGGRLTVRGENVTLRDGEVTGLSAGDYVKLSFHDTGPGIPEANQERIFDPYFTTKPKGSGLGLAISYGIVQKHEGSIKVSSEAGRGTTIDVYLPVSTAAPEPKSPDGTTTPRGSGRVLVMDDEEPVRRVTCGLLEHLGYTPVAVEHGEAAVQRYQEELREGRPFDAVILDLTVPGGMGGPECLARLKAIDHGVRAIVSSGYADDPVMAQYRTHGFLDVLVKPYQPTDLARVLKRLLPSAA